MARRFLGQTPFNNPPFFAFGWVEDGPEVTVVRFKTANNPALTMTTYLTPSVTQIMQSAPALTYQGRTRPAVTMDQHTSPSVRFTTRTEPL